MHFVALVSLVCVLGQSSLAQVAAGPRVWLSDHLWTSPPYQQEEEAGPAYAQSLLTHRAAVPNVCRDQIRRTLVLFEPGGSRTQSIPGGANVTYATFLEGIYDALPKALQRMFCSVSRVEIGYRAHGLLVSGLGRDGVELSFNRSLLDHLTEAGAYFSWFEQLPFGAPGDALFAHPDLPHVRIESPKSGVFVLTLLSITHAFAHLFDLAGDVAGDKGPFSLLTWQDAGRPLPAHDFAGRADLAFGRPAERLFSRAEAPSLYCDWARSGFVTLYAATHPAEDFAESLALYVLSQQKGAQMGVVVNDAESYDLLKRFRGEGRPQTSGARTLQQKLAFVRGFLAAQDLVYP